MLNAFARKSAHSALARAAPAARRLPLHAAPVRGMASKEIKFGNEARALLLQGVDRLAEAVKVTLGPKVCRASGVHARRLAAGAARPPDVLL
jgi:hypothetical protein